MLQHPQQGHTVRIIPALTLKLFEIQDPCQTRKDGRCFAPGNCLEVHQEGPTCSAGDGPPAPVTVGQWHSSGGSPGPSACAVMLCLAGGTSGDVSLAETPNCVTSVLVGSCAWYGMPEICVPSPILYILSQELQDWRTCLHIPRCCQDLQVTPQQSKAVPHTPNAIICYFHGWTPCAVAHPCGTGDM